MAGEILRVSVVCAELDVSKHTVGVSMAPDLKILTEARCNVGCARVIFSYDLSVLIATRCLAL